MARKKSNSAGSSPFAGMGSITGSSKEVNPSFSLKKAPVAKPATKRNTQVNPTFSAGNSQGNTNGAKRIASPTRVNPTFSVAHAGSENSKGPSGRKFVAAKKGVGNPVATKANPTPLKATYKSKDNGVTAKIFAIPIRSPKVNASGSRSRYDEENVNSAPATPKMTKGNFKGTKNQGNAKKKPAISITSAASRGNFPGTHGNGQITTGRLKKLGF